MKSFPDKIRICETIINTIKILNMKLIYNFVASLFLITYVYSTTTEKGSNGEPCIKEDNTSLFVFICMVVGFYIIKNADDIKREQGQDAYYDSDEDEALEEDSGTEGDTEEDADTEESEEELEEELEENEDFKASSEDDTEEPVEEPPVKTRKSRRLGSKQCMDMDE